MSQILVTPRSLTSAPDEALAPLQDAGFHLVFAPAGRQPSEDELIRLVPGCAGWLAGVEPITARVLNGADALRVISRNGTGVDSINLAAAEARGVRVRTASGANAAAVAELTLALMLAGLRHIPQCSAALKAGAWQRIQGRELGSRTVGLIGYGAVGRTVARTLDGFGATVLAYDIAADPGIQPSPRFSWVPLDVLLARSEIVSLHCPALPSGQALLDRARIGRLPPGAGIVNTARASLIDEQAVLTALDDGQLGWYATDVFASEPPSPSPLLRHERVIATPHIGAFTAEGGRKAIRVAVDNLLAELVGTDA